VNEASLISQLLASLEERMERAAYRGYKRAACEVAQADEIGSEDAAKILGKPTVNALRQFMQRAAVPHRRVGRRLLFSRAALLAWIEERSR